MEAIEELNLGTENCRLTNDLKRHDSIHLKDKLEAPVV